jgi:hypothetical protein
MTWQRSLQVAVRALKKEESQLVTRLETLRAKIGDLESMAKEGAPQARRASTGRRRLSPAGRAAISKAAKKRWAKYRSDQSRKPRRKS